ncbi:complement C1q and tumor necrosis factor-related protein 9A [Paramormyrops kingsleyae]|uniref:C1q and TNF related 9 n=1 Tax=Paramormyrops kingsleyae TaxID=1676925 RepID=A0A3B3QDZ9_9TELE|nr:complement C1q and tumor necrosis factor-related protein 9-like [Paramormyrops kingsleyae]
MVTTPFLWFLLTLAPVGVLPDDVKGGGCVCGYPGIPGDPGHNGAPGRDGRDGVKGEKGDQGVIGADGLRGQEGAKGPKGDPGDPGLSGMKGKRGENGERGWPGKMGPQGVPGPLGLKGDKGELGLPGSRGVKGEEGPQGPEGNRGPIGIKGERGVIGPSGPTGRPGIKGDIGAPGQKGSIGFQGEKGDRGDQGEKGVVGDMPVIPKSAFSVGLTDHSKRPPVNTAIRFDKIIYNQQGHYDAQTGRFSCAFAGAYYFTYHITVYSRNVKVALVRNGARIIHTMDIYQNGEDQAAGGTVLHLEAGDKVWLQVVGGELYNGLFADEDDDTTFSGFLIFAN